MSLAQEIPIRLQTRIDALIENAPSSGWLTEAEKAATIERIKAQLKLENATIVAHYYVDDELQQLADETGGYVSDSLDMANFGANCDADTLVVCGVRFMGETAKILSPEKRILMPTLEAECSLDLGCPINEFSAFCDAHPERVVVVYANTSAAVKARADWVVTSSNAIEIIKHIQSEGKNIIWGPDRHLGAYIQEKTDADMLLWQGHCVVHDEFQAEELMKMREHYPDAKVLVHPESPRAMVQLADFVGSTKQIINAARDSNAKTFIVGTDYGIFYKMQQMMPDKLFLAAPTGGKSATCKSCAHCPWMAMNTLSKLEQTLREGKNEIFIDEQLRLEALKPLNRMLNFSKQVGILTDGDA